MLSNPQFQINDKKTYTHFIRNDDLIFNSLDDEQVHMRCGGELVHVKWDDGLVRVRLHGGGKPDLGFGIYIPLLTAYSFNGCISNST